MTEKLDKSGRSELHYICIDVEKSKRNKIALDLIKKGFDVNLKDKNGQTPLHSAAQEKDKDICEILINAGAKINEKDKWGNTPLSVAITQGLDEKGEIINLLLNKGADPLIKNNYGSSALDVAKQISNYDFKKFFKKYL